MVLALASLVLALVSMVIALVSLVIVLLRTVIPVAMAVARPLACIWPWHAHGHAFDQAYGYACGHGQVHVVTGSMEGHGTHGNSTRCAFGIRHRCLITLTHTG